MDGESSQVSSYSDYLPVCHNLMGLLQPDGCLPVETCLENDVLSAQDGLAWRPGIRCRDHGSMALCPAVLRVLLPMAVTHQTCRDTCGGNAALCPLAGFVRRLHHGDDQLNL